MINIQREMIKITAEKINLRSQKTSKKKQKKKNLLFSIKINVKKNFPRFEIYKS
jgi:hypothetical protein